MVEGVAIANATSAFNERALQVNRAVDCELKLKK
jgi:hypothetical protein